MLVKTYPIPPVRPAPERLPTASAPGHEHDDHYDDHYDDDDEEEVDDDDDDDDDDDGNGDTSAHERAHGPCRDLST